MRSSRRRGRMWLPARPQNPKLMLETDHVHVADVQEIRGGRVRGEVVLEKLEADSLRISIPFGYIVHRNCGTVPIWQFPSHSLAEVSRKGGDATLSRNMIAD